MQGTLWKKYASFIAISGTGLLVATLILWLGVRFAGLSAFAANFIGDTVAVTLVFFASAYRTFVHARHFMLAKFAAYVAWQAIHIFLISWAVSALVGWTRFVDLFASFAAPEVAAKLLVTPVTVSANFLVALVLIEKIKQ